VEAIERNPMDDFERATVHKKEVQIIEPDAYEKYLNRARDTLLRVERVCCRF
jgi:hypothetical protein